MRRRERNTVSESGASGSMAVSGPDNVAAATPATSSSPNAANASPNAAASAALAPQANLLDIEELLHGFNWRNGDGASALEERLRTQLLQLELQNIKGLIESSAQTRLVSDQIDAALALIDELSHVATEQLVALSAGAARFENIQRQSHSLMIQARNQGALVEVLEQLVGALKLPADVEETLMKVPLDSTRNVERVLAAVAVLRDAMQTQLDPLLCHMSVFSEQSGRLIELSASFAVRIFETVVGILFRLADAACSPSASPQGSFRLGRFYSMPFMLNASSPSSSLPASPSQVMFRARDHSELEARLHVLRSLFLWLRTAEPKYYTNTISQYVTHVGRMYASENAEILSAVQASIPTKYADLYDNFFSGITVQSGPTGNSVAAAATSAAASITATVSAAATTVYASGQRADDVDLVFDINGNELGHQNLIVAQTNAFSYFMLGRPLSSSPFRLASSSPRRQRGENASENNSQHIATEAKRKSAAGTSNKELLGHFDHGLADDQLKSFSISFGQAVSIIVSLMQRENDFASVLFGYADFIDPFPLLKTDEETAEEVAVEEKPRRGKDRDKRRPPRGEPGKKSNQNSKDLAAAHHSEDSSLAENWHERLEPAKVVAKCPEDLRKLMTDIFGKIPATLVNLLEQGLANCCSAALPLLEIIEVLVSRVPAENRFLLDILAKMQGMLRGAWARFVGIQLNAVRDSIRIRKKAIGALAIVRGVAPFLDYIHTLTALSTSLHATLAETFTPNALSNASSSFNLQTIGSVKARNNDTGNAQLSVAEPSASPAPAPRTSCIMLAEEAVGSVLRDVIDAVAGIPENPGLLIENAVVLSRLLEIHKAPTEFCTRVTTLAKQHLDRHLNYLLRKGLGRFVEFFQSIEGLLATQTAEEIIFQRTYNKAAARRVISEYSQKEMAKHFEYMHRKMHKFFTEPYVLAQVWRLLLEAFSSVHESAIKILRDVYQNELALEYTLNEINKVHNSLKGTTPK